MNKKLIAMMSALVMSFSAVSFAASATEEPETLPDWIPQNFTEALRFDNEYGKTHIEDGLICCVRQKSVDERYEYTTEYSDDDSMDLLTLSSETYSFVLPEKPDESDTEAYKEYLNFLGENHLSEFDVETMERYGSEITVQFDYEVTVYSMNPSGSAEINWRRNYKETGKVMETTMLTFESSEDGEITETDIYGWFPDSTVEAYNFANQNGEVSIYNGCIVFCGDVCWDGGLSLLFEQTGTAELENIKSDAIFQQYVMFPVGNSPMEVRAYKPLNAGQVKVTFTQAQNWNGGMVADVITKYYDVDDDGNITEIDGEINAGDCNGDGKFTISDVVMFQKWISGQGDITNWKNADFTWDNKLDIFDLTIMKQELLKTIPKITAKTENITADDITILKSEILSRFPDTDMSGFSFEYNPDAQIAGEVFSVYYKGLLVHGYGDINSGDSVYASIIKRTDGLREVKINLVQSPEDIIAVDRSVKVIDRYEMKKMLDSEEYPELIIYVDYKDKPVLAYRLEDSNGYGETIYDAVTGEKIIYISYLTCVLPIEYA